MSDNQEPDISADLYPILAELISGYSTEEIWKYAPSSVLYLLEVLLAEIKRKEPERFRRKFTEFKTQTRSDLSLNTRSELAVAAFLLRAGIQIEFGAPGEPDFLCTSNSLNSPFRVEVTCRTLDGMRDLHEELTERLDSQDGEVVVTFSRRFLRIGSHEIQATCDAIQRDLETLEVDHSNSIPLPHNIGQALCTKGSKGNGLSVCFHPVDPDAQFYGEAAEALLGVLRKKTKIRQASIGSTLLVVDVSRLGSIWLLSEQIWSSTLQRMEIPWDELPYKAVAIVWTGLSLPFFHGHVLSRPDCDQTSMEWIKLIADAIGSNPIAASL